MLHRWLIDGIMCWFYLYTPSVYFRIENHQLGCASTSRLLVYLSSLQIILNFSVQIDSMTYIFRMWLSIFMMDVTYRLFETLVDVYGIMPSIAKGGANLQGVMRSNMPAVVFFLDHYRYGKQWKKNRWIKNHDFLLATKKRRLAIFFSIFRIFQIINSTS